MGWYESPKHPGAMVGDEAFDVTHAFLAGLARAYQEGLGRKPTLEEVRALLEVGLRVSGGDFLSDVEEREITQVAIKAAKKPKDQRFQVGDVFALPVAGVGFAFGRIMVLEKSKGMLVEVFRKTSPARLPGAAVLASGRLFQPVVMAGGADSLKTWRWTVVASDEGYEAPAAEIKTFEYVSPDLSGKGYRAVSFGGKTLRQVSDAEAREMVSGRLWSPAQVEELVGKKLG